MGIKKKTRRRIKKYAEIMSKKNPDYKYECFLQAYEDADERTRRFYDYDMKNAVESDSVDDQS